MKQISPELLEAEDDGSGNVIERAAYRQIQFGVMRMSHALIGPCNGCQRMEGCEKDELLFGHILPLGGHGIVTPVPIHIGLKASAAGMQIQVANRPAMPGLCTVCAMLNVWSGVIRQKLGEP